MGKALYRKYRPKTLSEVVGQSHITTPLQNALDSGKISHAYLFVGPRGCGKTSVARIFAHAVNQFDYELEDNYVDIIEIDGASNRGIDNIRELREKVAIAPTKGKYKIYIIDEVHMLTKEAFNALLKTIEEPPAHAIFIMATTDYNKVPVTITSRAQIFQFKLADSETMFTHLKAICEKEGIKIEDAALKIVVRRGGGSFRDSLSLLDQISTLSNDTITEKNLLEALGLPADEAIKDLLNSYTTHNLDEITAKLKDLLNTGIKPETVAESLIQIILENPNPAIIPLLAKLPDVRAPFPEVKLLLAFTDFINAPAVVATPIVAAPKAIPKEAPSLAPKPATSTTVKPTPAEAPEPAPTPEPSETPAPATPIQAPSEPPKDATSFWQIFVQNVAAKSSVTAKYLEGTTYEISETTLNIYPEKSFSSIGLSRDKSKAILAECSNGLRIVVHELKKSTGKSTEIKDPLVSQISDIMGGAEEVKQNGGEIPF